MNQASSNVETDAEKPEHEKDCHDSPSESHCFASEEVRRNSPHIHTTVWDRARQSHPTLSSMGKTL
jgi:hypothetical protein